MGKIRKIFSKFVDNSDRGDDSYDDDYNDGSLAKDQGLLAGNLADVLGFQNSPVRLKSAQYPTIEETRTDGNAQAVSAAVEPTIHDRATEAAADQSDDNKITPFPKRRDYEAPKSEGQEKQNDFQPQKYEGWVTDKITNA